jgi:hypothetical protein
MDNKVEPVLTEISDNIPESVNLEKAPDISKILNIVRKQAEVNNEVISTLADTELSKKQQLEMIQLLNDGAERSAFFVKLLKENTEDISIEINENIPAKSKINDKYNKFKNMIASAKASVDPSIVFRNPSKHDWYEIGHKVGLNYKIVSSKAKSIRETLDSFLTQSANKLNIATKKVSKTSNFFQSQFILIGEKRNVKTLEKKFAKLFDLLGVNAKEILHSSEITENLSSDELHKRINTQLEKTVNAVKDQTSNQFKFTILNGLTPDLQLTMAQTILWPKLNSAIKESMEVSNNLQQSKNDNKYLKMVNEFAEANKFHPDLVIHSLKNNPDLLSGYPKSKLLLSNAKEILDNSAKYGKIIINNFNYLDSLVKASNDLHNTIKGLNVSQELKNAYIINIDNTVIFSDETKTITFAQLNNNVTSIKPEERGTSPKLSKN